MTISFLLFSFSLFAQVPVITGISPSSGPAGSTVTINGANFSVGTTANIVYFGPVKATPTTATNVSIVVTVPPGATYQPISVTNASGRTGFSTQSFISTLATPVPLVATSFPAYSTYTTANSPSGVTPCDLDGDGKADIICASSSYGALSILRNTSTAGTISFAPRTDITNPSWSYSIHVTLGDIDGDGKKDLVAFNSNDGNFFIYKNTSVPGTISFATPVEAAAVAFSGKPQIADFDGDGKPDISFLRNTGFSIVRNTTTGGTISFAPKEDVTVGSANLDMAISDFNVDGKPDVALADYTNNTMYALANTSTPGTISFAPKTDLATNANGPRFISAGDIDGDGYTDLALTYYNTGEISLYKNTTTAGNISFSRQTDIANTTMPLSLSFGNVNGDDKPDLLMGAASVNAISVFQNTTSGSTFSFAPKRDFAVYTAANSIVACDMNNDGKTDLFSGGSSSNIISVLPYSQNKPFISSFTPVSGKLGSSISIIGSNFTGITRVAAGDSAVSSFTVLTDTSITAIIGNGATGSITVTNAVGTGTKTGFTYRQPPVIASFTPLSGVAGTTITLTGYGFGSTPQSNIVYFGLLKGTIISASTTEIKVAVPVGATYAPLMVYNGSLAGSTAKYFTPVSFTAPLVAGSFALPVRMANTPNSSQDMLWADMNNDGKPDLITNSNGPTIARNKSTPGNVVFDSLLTFAADLSFGYPSLADISGDGLPDVIGLSPGSNKMAIFKNASVNGSLAMGFRYEYTTGASPSNAAAGDIDGDGRIDIVVTNNGANSISVFLNTTAGGGFVTLAPKVDFATGAGPQRITLADFDQDGKPDIVVLNVSASPSISVFKNTSVQGIVSFAPRTDYPAASGSYFIGVADADGDGYLDIATSGFFAPTISVFRNAGNSSNLLFTQRMDIPTASDLQGISFGDMDGDTKPDMLVTLYTGKAIGFFKNTGVPVTVSFDTAITYPILRGSRTIIAADVDGDGKTDMIADEFGPYYLRNKINELPVITSFLPATAGPGDTLLIKGRNFSGLTAISFGGVAINSFTLLSDTTIRVFFNTGASGDVAVTTTYGTASLPGFTALSIPVVNSFIPVAGAVGSVVTISGSGFSSTLIDNLVSFGPNKAQVVTASTSTLTVRVPKGATQQKLWVTVNGRTGFSVLPFQTTFPGAAPTFANTYFDTTNRIVVAGEANVRGLTAFDIDGDSKTDIALATESSSYVRRLYVYKGTGSGNYLSYTQTAVDLNASTYVSPSYPLAVDVNSDGKPDLNVDNKNDYYPAGVFINRSVPGSISLAALTGIYGPVLTDNRSQYADFDGDGRPDLLIKSVYFTGITIFRNTGTLSSVSFSAAINIGSTGSSPSSDSRVLLEDFNGDGKPDIGVVATGQLSFFINTGTKGRISFAAPVAIANDYGRAAVADLDGDGKLDIVQAINQSTNARIVYLRNTSNGTALSFAPVTSIVTITTSNGIGGLTVADMDGDSKPDICASTFVNSSAVSIFKNTSMPSTISFLPGVEYPAARATEIVVGDIDNDGKPDLLTSSLTSNVVSILRNRIGEPLPILLCPPVASAAIAAGITGTTYQWQADTGTGFINITDNANYSGTNAATLQLINIPAAWYGYKYSCTASGTNSNTYVLQFINSWRGTASTNWNDPANWTCGALPDGNTDVVVDAGTVIITANAICRTILVKPGATLKINPGVTLTVTH